MPVWLRAVCANDSGEDPGHEDQWEGLSRKEVATLDRRAELYVDFILRLTPFTRAPRPRLTPQPCGPRISKWT